MKPIAIILSVLILILLGGYIFYSYILESSHLMDKELTTLDSSVRGAKWSSASSSILRVENKWSGMKDTWALFIDHQELDNINLSMTKIKQYIKGKDTIDSLAEISSLKLLFEHIPEKEALSMKNIL